MHKVYVVLSLLIIHSVALAQNVSFSYSTIGEMEEPRLGHTATIFGAFNPGNALASVLIVGGSNGSSISQTAEVSGESIPMLQRRVNHTADFSMGLVFIAGGYDGDITNHASTEIFSPETMEFTEGPTMQSGRSYHRTVVLNDGRILITGGFNGTEEIALCELFDPSSQLLSSAASMNVARSSHTATLLPDGRVLVTGGFNPNQGFQMANSEIYDPLTNQWTVVADMNTTRDNHAAALGSIEINGTTVQGVMVNGGRFFNSNLNLFEGRLEVEFYNLQTNEWINLEPNQQGQSYHQLHYVLFEGNPLWFVPGSAATSGSGVDQAFSTLEHTSTGEWFASSTPSGRYQYASVVFTNALDTWLYVFGGLGSEGDALEMGLYIINTVGVNETASPSFSVYPQPASDAVTLRLTESGNWFYKLHDAVGRVISTGNFVGSNQQIALPNDGYFLIEVYNENTRFTSPIVSRRNN
jgi:hypothetical protein